MARRTAEPPISWLMRIKLERPGLISLAAGFLGNDSGALNVAAAVGTPCVGLMGTAPVPAYSRWLSRLDGGQGRISDITVDEAVAALRARFVAERWGDARA